MPKKMLTAASVARIKPDARRRLEMPDAGAPGLRLVVQPSGTKSWAMRFRRPGGRSTKLTLGPADLTGGEPNAEPSIGSPLTLAAARRLAVEIQHQRARGRDVMADAAAERRRRAAVHSRLFGLAALRFVEEYAKKNHSRWRETAMRLGLRPGADDRLITVPRGLCDRWRDRPLSDVDPAAIYDLIDDCRMRGYPGAITRKTEALDSRGLGMHRTLSKFFAWAMEHRLADTNPVRGVYRPSQGPAGDRVLADAEIRLFWSAAEALEEPFGPLFKLLLLTGQRRGEVAGMTVGELSEDGRLWTLPAIRTKNRRPHAVPLSSQAREVLASVRPVDGRKGYIFSTTGKTPVSGFSRAKRRLDTEMLKLSLSDKPSVPWRLHDLRRTAATGMAEIGVAPHVVEAFLNHVSGARAGVAGVYNRAEYAAKKRSAADIWGAHLSSLIK
ncbi:MAG: tyrosine-type recombinase/integrase [Alphaproteobacteria bacterium]